MTWEDREDMGEKEEEDLVAKEKQRRFSILSVLARVSASVRDGIDR